MKASERIAERAKRMAELYHMDMGDIPYGELALMFTGAAVLEYIDELEERLAKLESERKERE